MDFGFSLTDYMSERIEQLVNNALRTSTNNFRESIFLIKYLFSSRKAKQMRTQYEKTGTHIPPFLIAGITSSCNLFCKGCYARANKSCGEQMEQNELKSERWDQIFAEAKELGIAFILLAGGEPLIRKDIILSASRFKNIIFPVFTNGTMIDEEYINIFNRNRNLIPILSLEGKKEDTDKRRGDGVYDSISNVMKRLKQKGIFFGASITVTKENWETVTGEEFISQLSAYGCKIAFFVEYVPVDINSKHLAPSEKDRENLEFRLHYLREKWKELIFLAFPGDEKSIGGCLAAGRGFFYINMDGKAEPCPFSPYSDRNLKDCSLISALKSPLFIKLNQDGMLLGEHDGGCLLFEKEDEVKELLKK
ncbi:MAG: radical SAM protein [Clostridiales bacterium]|nr:radical SAM protein [Clostridiales bacterium]